MKREKFTKLLSVNHFFQYCTTCIVLCIYWKGVRFLLSVNRFLMHMCAKRVLYSFGVPQEHCSVDAAPTAATLLLLLQGLLHPRLSELAAATVTVIALSGAGGCS
jgi:hypothetical protein